MAEKKATVVIKKIKKGGHAGHHGGAWKVAYADFVTAMMCFFLVMWLMGTDETTKAAIAAYFNNPSVGENSATADSSQVSLGDQVGPGDSVVRGVQGQVPEDLVRRPQDFKGRSPDSVGPTNSEGMLSREDLMAAESLTFIIKEDQLFQSSTTEAMMQNATKPLASIQKVAKNFRGKLLIRTSLSRRESRDYEFQMRRLVKIKELIVEQRWFSEEFVKVTILEGRSPASVSENEDGESVDLARRYEFHFLK